MLIGSNKEKQARFCACSVEIGNPRLIAWTTPRASTGCLRRSLLICRPQAGEIVGATAGFSTRYTCAMRPIDDIACFKPGCDNFGKRGVNIVGHSWFTTKSGGRRRYRCNICGGNGQHEYGHSVQRSPLHSEGVRPSSEPASRGREHFCDGPSHGSFPQHHRPLARAGLESGRALQPANAAGLRNR